MDPRTTFRSCDRAREAASRALDGDLSLFEARLLAAHLDVCAACSAFQASAAATAVELRAAPLERLTLPVSLPRRRSLRPLQSSAAAAMAAAAVLVLTVAAPVDLSDDPTTRFVAAPSVNAERIVADGEPFPADRGDSVERKFDTLPE